MTSTPTDVCRIRVFGPDGRMDLAVPLTVTVASLLPVFAQRMKTEEGGAGTAWVLQRLGEAPFDPAGTPESLDWRDGQEFHLRPAADALPEMEFDDIADGMAVTVGARPGRWRPDFNRWLFLGLVVGTLVLLGVLLFGVVPNPDAIAESVVGAAALLVAAITAGVRGADDWLVLPLGLGGCGFAAIAGAVWPDGRASWLLGAGVGLALAAAVVLVARSVRAGSAWTFPPFAVLAGAGVLGAVSEWLRMASSLSSPRVAGLLGTVLLILLVVAPRAGIRIAQLRGPQLPHTSEDLQGDVAPLAGDDVRARTLLAANLLTTVTQVTAIGVACCVPFLVGDGVFGMVLAGLFGSVLLLRSRGFLDAWQRVPLVLGGAFGAAVLVSSLAMDTPPRYRWLVVTVVAVVLTLLVAVMERPVHRRPKPIWAHLANLSDTGTTIAIVPILLQVLGIYGWARGLIG